MLGDIFFLSIHVSMAGCAIHDGFMVLGMVSWPVLSLQLILMVNKKLKEHPLSLVSITLSSPIQDVGLSIPHVLTS